MSKNIIVGGTEFVTGDEWSKYVLKMHNLICRCDDHIRCLKNIINELVNNQGDLFNIYQKRLSGAITYMPAPADDVPALIEKIRELKGEEPSSVKMPEQCTDPIKLTEYLNYVNDLHNVIIKRCSAILEDPEKWRNENAIVENIFNFAPVNAHTGPEPEQDAAKAEQDAAKAEQDAAKAEQQLRCKSCTPQSAKSTLTKPNETMLYETLNEVPKILLDVKYLKSLQDSSKMSLVLYKDSVIVNNQSRYGNVIIYPVNNYETISVRYLCDEYFSTNAGIWIACPVGDVAILVKSNSGQSYNTVDIAKNIMTWLENNQVNGQLGTYNLKKYLALLKNEGFIVHHSALGNNEEIVFNLRNRYTKTLLNTEFNRYLNYSEYDIINMDWSDYDKKIYPLVKSKFEYAYSAKIENGKILISHIFKEHGSSSEVITPVILDYICGHTHPSYRYEGMDLEPPSVDDIDWFILESDEYYKNYNNRCIFNMISAAEGTYIISVPKGFKPVLNHAAYFEQFNKITGRYTFEGAISKLKRIYSNFEIVLYFRPTPGFNMTNNTYPAASFLKLTDNDIETFTTNFKDIKKTDFIKMDLTDFDIRQTNISDYSFILYPSKLIKNKLTPAPFSHYTFNEDFNSITHDIMPISLPIKLTCIVIYFSELPSIISFDSIKLINSTYARFSNVKYYLILSKKQLSVVYYQNDTFELYGPINR